MTRALLTLAIAGTLAAWAAAQTAAGPITSERLAMLRQNQRLLDDLVDHGLKVSNANTPLDRADECRRAVALLSNEIKQSSENADRVVELTDNLAKLIDDGLAPALAEARGQITPKSSEYDRLKAVYDLTKNDLAATATTLQAGKSAKVTAARNKLAAAADAVGLVE